MDLVVIGDDEQRAALAANVAIGFRSHGDRRRCRGDIADARRPDDPQLESAPFHGDAPRPVPNPTTGRGGKFRNGLKAGPGKSCGLRPRGGTQHRDLD